MWKKKIKEPPNVIKVQSHVMLVLPNVTMTPLNVRKNKEPSNASKVRSYVMLVLPNMTMVKCHVGTTQCNDGTTYWKRRWLPQPRPRLPAYAVHR